MRRAPTPRADGMPALDRTTRMYIGGRQLRPDGGYTMVVRGAAGENAR